MAVRLAFCIVFVPPLLDTCSRLAHCVLDLCFCLLDLRGHQTVFGYLEFAKSSKEYPNLGSYRAVALLATESSTNCVMLLLTTSPHVPLISPVTGRANPRSDVYWVVIIYLRKIYVCHHTQYYTLIQTSSGATGQTSTTTGGFTAIWRSALR